MTWRRMAPWVIAVVALLAIFIDLPRSVPAFSWLPSNVLGTEFRTVLGLDLDAFVSERIGLDDIEAAFEKFWPRKWLVPHWSAFASRMSPSIWAD